MGRSGARSAPARLRRAPSLNLPQRGRGRRGGARGPYPENAAAISCAVSARQRDSARDAAQDPV